MTITENKQNDKIILEIEGRVDTTTAPELQNAILLSFQKMMNLVLDFTKVEYISSAGLRALLMGQKTEASKGGSMILTNVSDMVMEVLTMTGFDGILQIQK